MAAPSLDVRVRVRVRSPVVCSAPCCGHALCLHTTYSNTKYISRHDKEKDGSSKEETARQGRGCNERASGERRVCQPAPPKCNPVDKPFMTHSYESPLESEQSPTPEVPSQSASPADEPPEPDGAEKVKEEGNAAFKAGRFNDAVEAYTRAIGVCLLTVHHH